MSSNKEEKGDAADRIKAAALTAAKGLSRAQAERAATAAARNVNAYGQKEEGPSRWQERKEAKRQMYLMSTEKQVRLGERKDKLPGSMSTTTVNSHSQCQKCYQVGHWTYECKNERVYISRPSRTQQLKNPKLRTRFLDRSELDYPDIVPEEEPKVENKSKKKNKICKRKHSDSESGSEASVFESDSGSDDDDSSAESESSSSSLSSLDSREKRRLRRKKEKMKKESKGKKHRKRRYSSSSESSSDSESDSESDSKERGSRKKGSRRHSRKR